MRTLLLYINTVNYIGAVSAYHKENRAMVPAKIRLLPAFSITLRANFVGVTILNHELKIWSMDL